ncbi:MAG: hypothetical protein DMD33_12775 [Gemmatimonadetes bacterium]|nr:MAG: hypothetical protein DMD33_12775 [Gemmatimonadota bacterium]
MDGRLSRRTAHRYHRLYVHGPRYRAGARRRGVTNLTYEVLQREYEKLRPQLPRFCGCETCRGDVLVFALNRLSPNYVSTPQGEVLVELRLDSDQEKAKLDVALLDAFRRVGLAPRCGARSVQLL